MNKAEKAAVKAAEAAAAATATATVETVETPKFTPITLGTLPRLTSKQMNGLAREILETCATNQEGKYLLPSGKSERELMATLIGQATYNAMYGKALVTILTGGGLRAFLSGYTDAKGLFSSKKALIEYVSKEENRKEVEEFPFVGAYREEA